MVVNGEGCPHWDGGCGSESMAKVPTYLPTAVSLPAQGGQERMPVPNRKRAPEPALAPSFLGRPDWGCGHKVARDTGTAPAG